MPPKPSRLLIVVPTYNERKNLPALYQRIRRHARTAHLLVVDDGSPDGTGEVAESLAAKDRRIHVMHRGSKLGLGTAYVAGFQYALERGYELVLAMDADLSHDPTNIPRMLALMADHDLVIGSRYVKDGGMVNWGVGRFFISKFANGFLKWLLRIRQQDCSGGYKCYRASLLRKIGLDRIFSRGYSFQVEILYRALRQRARVKEIPIIFVNRHEGESKLSLAELTGFAGTVFRLRWMAWWGRL